MILWCDGPHEAGENMRRDAALLAAAGRGAPPVLRLFGFSPPGITLGRHQDASRELDLARCEADGIGWAVRPTGGRAIFHDQEWTYALASPMDDAEWGGGPAETYARASRLMLRALLRLGVPAELAPRRSGGSPGPRGRGGAAPPCFASTARHEVVVRDLKLVGSAQRRTTRAWLQQGSILLGEGHLRIADYLRVASFGGERARDDLRGALRRATAPAARWLGGRPPLERLADAVQRELPADSPRLDGAAGVYLLTVSGTRSYTPAVV